MFVTFEGPEGSGKSTAIRAIAEALPVPCLVTREPGAGEVGRRIREILLEGEAIDPRCELFLFLADRAQHVASTILPALKDGKVVLCDRHADSTIVYQGYGRGLNLDWLRELNQYATNDLKPDLTLLFDLDPEVGLARVTDKDRLDNEALDFHQRVRDGFRTEAEREPQRWTILNAAQSPQEVANDALNAILARMNS
jgi:dTMP kinase